MTAVQRLVQFISAVYEEPELRTLPRRYLDAVQDIIPCRGYGFYLYTCSWAGEVLPKAALPTPDLVASRGVSNEFLDSYERTGRSSDPVFALACSIRQPVHSGMLPAAEWQAQAACRLLADEGLVHCMDAPIVIGGQVRGVLNFARGAEEPPFTQGEADLARMISHLTGYAIRCGLELQEHATECLRLGAVLDALHTGALVIDPGHGIRPVNRRGRQLLLSEGGPQMARLVREQSYHFLSQNRRRMTVAASVTRAGHSWPVILRLTRSSFGDSVVAFVQEDEVPRDLEHLTETLTRRELDVLRLVVRGETNAAAARALGVSINTVKQYLKRLFTRFGVRSRQGLVAAALGGAVAPGRDRGEG